jgi:hypothetical protein
VRERDVPLAVAVRRDAGGDFVRAGPREATNVGAESKGVGRSRKAGVAERDAGRSP